MGFRRGLTGRPPHFAPTAAEYGRIPGAIVPTMAGKMFRDAADAVSIF